MGPGQESGKVTQTMLQGTLDVFSLDEVLGLLSGANKTGVLNITGDRGVGSVSIADGHLVAGSASSAPEAAELSDVLFELLRYEEGSFSFDGAATPEGHPHELAGTMAEARSRLSEWQAIEAVVPSLDHHLALAETLTTTQVTLSESEWAAIVAIGEGATVGVIARRLGLGEFDGSKRVKSLVERSLAMISEGAHTAAAPSAAEAEVTADEPAAFTETVFATPEPAPTSFSEAAPEDEPLAAAQPEAVAPKIVAPEAVASEFADAGFVDAGPISDFSFETAAPEVPSFETVASDAPAFEDAPVEPFEVDAGIPPMPDVPSFASFEAAENEIPPMPEPPSTFAEPMIEDSVPAPPFATDVLDAPIPPAPEVPSFGGLDPMSSADMFEPPHRNSERSAGAFGGDGFAAATDAESADFEVVSDLDAPMPPPPALADSMPSFAAPAAFDADAFSANDDQAIISELPVEASDEADDGSEQDDKGGSLLMRYLKSNG